MTAAQSAQFDGVGGSLAVSGDNALVGAPGTDNAAGAAYIFTHQRTHWILTAVLTDPGDLPGDQFGSHVAMYGGTAMVSSGTSVTYVYIKSGSRWHLQATLPGGTEIALTASIAVINEGMTGVQVYSRSGQGWSLPDTLTAPPSIGDTGFGCSIAASGETVVVSVCRGGPPGPGHALVYQPSKTGWQLTSDIVDPAAPAADSYGSSLAISGSTLIVGAPSSDVTISGDTYGAAFLYAHAKSGWTLQTIVRPPKSVQPGAIFGDAVAVSGKIAVVGARGVNNETGAAYVYTLATGQWHLQNTLVNPGSSILAGFGSSVAIVGTTALIGAPAEDAVYAYGQSGTRWNLQGDLIDPRALPGSNTGSAVAISGSIAIAGASGSNFGQGAAFIYAKSRAGWRQQTSLIGDGGFGAAVGASGSTVIVGQAGAASIYVRSAGGWHRQAMITDPTAGGFNFGASVAIAGSIAVIGAAGKYVAYVYRRTGTHWIEQAALTEPGRNNLTVSGGAVALSGDTIVVGDNTRNDDAGAAYIYHWTGSRWSLQGTLADPGGRPNDTFGTSVGVSGAIAVVGAPGVGDLVGAAYIYGRTGTRWRKQATLTIPRSGNIAGGFGSATAIDGTGREIAILLSGVSISGLTTTRTRCGSVFEFGHPTGRWHELEKIADPKCSSYDEFGEALSISGTTAVIGAPGADGNSGAAYLQTLKKPEANP